MDGRGVAAETHINACGMAAEIPYGIAGDALVLRREPLITGGGVLDAFSEHGEKVGAGPDDLRGHGGFPVICVLSVKGCGTDHCGSKGDNLFHI